MSSPGIDDVIDALERRPDDPVLRSLLSDLLLEAHEPQGLLLTASPSASGEVQAELDTVVRRTLHLDAFEPNDVRLEWVNGFVESLGIWAWSDSEARLARTWRRLVELVTAPRGGLFDPVERRVARLLRCLREVRVGPFGLEARYQPLWHLLRERPLPSSVRRVVADGFSSNIKDPPPNTWASLGSLEPAWPAFERLGSLFLRGSYADLTGLSLPVATSFEYLTSTFTRSNAAQVRAARWPRLARLFLSFGDDSYNDDPVTLDDVVALVGELPPTVRHLGLRNTTFTADLVAALASSPKLGQLETLDLSHGVLLGAHDAFIRHGAAYGQLRELNVGDTGLVETEELKRAVPMVCWRPQTQPDEGRFSSTGE